VGQVSGPAKTPADLLEEIESWSREKRMIPIERVQMLPKKEYPGKSPKRRDVDCLDSSGCPGVRLDVGRPPWRRDRKGGGKGRA